VHPDRRQFLIGALGLAITATACGSKGSSAKSGSSTATLGDASSASNAAGPASSLASTNSTPPTSAPPSTTAQPPTTEAPPTGPARYVSHGAATAKQVSLTFHTEGTVAQVTRLLDMARALEVPLTMCIVGKWLDQNRDLGRRIADAGHDIGNHTFNHLSLPDQGRDVVAREIRQCADLLRTVTGTPGRWFRPSGSNSTTTLINEEAGKAGYPVVLGFDVDPLDYQDPGAGAVRTRTVGGLHAGAIVSLHAQHAGTLDAFEALVADVRAKGYTLVRASDIVR
jgi:peptidoglycan/xylan/chitin deacetylase (PgdA/CDA1 family)